MAPHTDLTPCPLQCEGHTAAVDILGAPLPAGPGPVAEHLQRILGAALPEAATLLVLVRTLNSQGWGWLVKSFSLPRFQFLHSRGGFGRLPDKDQEEVSGGLMSLHL